MIDEINLTTDASEEEINQFIREVQEREELEEMYGFATLLAEAAREEINFRAKREEDALGEALSAVDPEPGSDADRI